MYLIESPSPVLSPSAKDIPVILGPCIIEISAGEPSASSTAELPPLPSSTEPKPVSIPIVVTMPVAVTDIATPKPIPLSRESL